MPRSEDNQSKLGSVPSPMGIRVCAVNLESDCQKLVDFFSRHLPRVTEKSMFDWLYRGNPHGQACAFLATDANDRLIGAAAAFPRRVYVEEREELCWVLGDFCIDEGHRALGPALQLQRACLAGVDAGEAAFCYDFPSQSMMAVYKRLRIDQWSRMVRLAKPLRVDRKIREFVSHQTVARSLSAVGNFLLSFSSRYSNRAEALTFSLHEGKCGEEFSLLAQRIGGQYGICVQRSAEYLNWRYLANPLYHYELITVRRGDALVAYAVFTHTKEDATLTDLFGINDPTIISNLVTALSALLRARGVMTVSVPMAESHPWGALLQRLGFRVRESIPIVVYVSPSLPAEHAILNKQSWFLMQGDRDS